MQIDQTCLTYTFYVHGLWCVYMAKALRDELTFHISKHKQVLFTQLMTWHVCIVAVKWLIDILLWWYDRLAITSTLERYFLFEFHILSGVYEACYLSAIKVLQVLSNIFWH